jgi:hypothetical protein
MGIADYPRGGFFKLPYKWKAAILLGMKTMLDLPDDLYRQAKTRAAAQNGKVKDLISEGLRMVLASQSGDGVGDQSAARQVLGALDDILRCPPAPRGRTKRLQAGVRRLRSEGWGAGEK